MQLPRLDALATEANGVFLHLPVPFRLTGWPLTFRWLSRGCRMDGDQDDYETLPGSALFAIYVAVAPGVV